MADKFEARWNFPNGTGAVDRKCVIVQQPFNSGSHYYNYQGNNSIVLLAVFGPDYQCLWASAGTNGRSPDSAIWQNCDLKKPLSLSHNTLNLPKPRALPETAMPVPYVLTGDDAFALTRFMMKPFPLTGLSRAQRIFNYRLSCMQRISDNCFVIIANRWRVFRAPILLPPDRVVDLILVALVLHNFLSVNGMTDQEDEEGNVIPGPNGGATAVSRHHGLTIILNAATITPMKLGQLEKSTWIIS